MGEMLKQYVLYEQLVRIDNEEYFQLDFKARELEEVFSAIRNQQDYAHDQSCLFFLFNLKAIGRKPIHLVLKWLVVTHQLLRLPLYPRLIEDIYKSLEKVGEPTHETPFEHYLYHNLFKTYLQYLLKYCIYKLKRAIVEQIKTSQEGLFFMKVNLLKFGINEFQDLFLEFGGFFYANYPFLTQYHRLLEKDLKEILEDMKRDYRRQPKKLLGWDELEDFEQAMLSLFKESCSQSSHIYDELLEDNEITACKIEEFFLSHSKEARLCFEAAQ